MNKKSEFPFERARRVTPEESQKFREAISEQFDMELRKRGSPGKNEEEEYEPISIVDRTPSDYSNHKLCYDEQ